MARRQTQHPPLTKKRIDAARYPHPKGSRRAAYLHDGALPRFSVRLYESGRKTYVVRVWVDGKQREKKVGDAAVLSLKEARAEARAMLVAADRGGIDAPRRKPQPAAPTFNAFVERYFEQHANALRSADEQRRLIARQLTHRFGKRRLDEITLHYVLQMRTELADTPYEANRAMDLLKTILNRAIRWEVLPDDFRNPVTKVDRFTESPRTRVLQRAEVDRLLDAVGAIDSEHTQVLFRVLFDLPLRKNEIMRATWEGFDAETATLRIDSRATNKGVAAQALTPALVAEIAALERFKGNPYIFPNRDRTSHIKDIDSQWSRVKELAGVTNARLHDLRRTIATEYARLGASEYQIQAALGQKTNVAARHYVHLAAAEVSRELMMRRAAAREG